MKVLLALVLLAIVVCVVWVMATEVSTFFSRAWRLWKASRTPWRMREVSTGEGISLYAERPGQNRILLGSVPLIAEDFDTRMYELRAQAEDQVRVLNHR